VAGNDKNLVRTKKFVQDPLRIVAGSPLAIQGVFLEILRERFKEHAGLYWVWRDDLTLTDIIIEAAFNEHLEARNKAPALYVYRLSTVPSKQILGDRAGVSLPSHKEGHGALNTVAMMIECISNDEGESAILADIVQFTLLAGHDAISREFGFYDISHPSLGQTAPVQRDQTKWATPVEFMVQFWIRWEQVPIRPLLQQIAQRLSARGLSADSHFIDTTINSIRRGVMPPPILPIPDTESYSLDETAPIIEPAPPIVEPLPLVTKEVFLAEQPLEGPIDGINKIFKTFIPFIRTDNTSEIVYVNGLRMTPGADGDYVISKSSPAINGYDTIEITYAPREGDILTIDIYVVVIE
jgi:hypothetical protein